MVGVRQGTLGVDVVVEVRQGTLGVDGRGGGPTQNTVDRESQLSRKTRRTTKGGGGRGGPGN